MANVADSESTARCEFSLVTTVHTDFRSESECLIRQPVPYRCDTCYGRASQTYCINLTRHLLWYRIRLILIMTDRCGSLFVCACERLSEGDYPHIVEKFPNDKWNYPTILSCSIFVVAFFYSNVFFLFFIYFSCGGHSMTNCPPCPNQIAGNCCGGSARISGQHTRSLYIMYIISELGMAVYDIIPQHYHTCNNTITI